MTIRHKLGDDHYVKNNLSFTLNTDAKSSSKVTLTAQAPFGSRASRKASHLQAGRINLLRKEEELAKEEMTLQNGAEMEL